jgi:hypothetical protein
MGQMGGVINSIMLFVTQCMMWSLTVVCVGFSALRVVVDISFIRGSPTRIVPGLVRLIRDALPMAALAFIVWILGTQQFHDDPMTGYVTGIGTMGVAMMLGPAGFLSALWLEGTRRESSKG